VVPVKHDFAEVFDRPIFNRTIEKVVMHRNGRVSLDKQGKTKTVHLPCLIGGPDPAFVKKHNLSINSHPADFAEVFIPYRLNPYNDCESEHLSFKTWTRYININAKAITGWRRWRHVHRLQTFFNAQDLSASWTVHFQWTESVTSG
jgi:hypothetical protein